MPMGFPGLVILGCVLTRTVFLNKTIPEHTRNTSMDQNFKLCLNHDIHHSTFFYIEGSISVLSSYFCSTLIKLVFETMSHGGVGVDTKSYLNQNQEV